MHADAETTNPSRSTGELMNAEVKQVGGPNGAATAEAQAVHSVTTALERLRDAGQRIIADEIGLAKLETQERLSRNVRMGIFIGAGAALALIAWCTLMGAACFALMAVMPVSAAVAVVGGFNVTIAGGLVGVGLAQTKGADKLPPSDQRGLGRHARGRDQQEGARP